MKEQIPSDSFLSDHETRIKKLEKRLKEQALINAFLVMCLIVGALWH